MAAEIGEIPTKKKQKPKKKRTVFLVDRKTEQQQILL